MILLFVTQTLLLGSVLYEQFGLGWASVTPLWAALLCGFSIPRGERSERISAAAKISIHLTVVLFIEIALWAIVATMFNRTAAFDASAHAVAAGPAAREVLAFVWSTFADPRTAVIAVLAPVLSWLMIFIGLFLGAMIPKPPTKD